MIRAIQRRWPGAKITWIIGAAEYRLVAEMPNIEFIPYNKRSGLRGALALRRRLTNRHFDVLLHAQVSLRANLLGRLVNAQRRIGFDRQRAREGHGWVINERIGSAPLQHQALAFMQFAKALDAYPDASTIDPNDRRLPVPEAARDFAAQHQPDENHAVLISPSSSHARRNWHAQGYAEVADAVMNEFRRPVILVGGPSVIERQLGEEITARMNSEPLNLIGKDTLPELLAMLDRSACLITPDSGPAHFAAALGTPVIGLYAATWSKRSGPFGSLEHCVDAFPEAARHYLKTAPENVRWGRRIERNGVMDLIRTERVLEKVRDVLRRP